MDIRVGWKWRLNTFKGLMLLNYGARRDSWTERRSNQSILKEIGLEYSLDQLMLKLKLQYFGHLMQRADSLEKTLMLGKSEGEKRRQQYRMRWLDSITDSIHLNIRKLQEIIEDRGAWSAEVHGVTKGLTWQWLNNTKHLNNHRY